MDDLRETTALLLKLAGCEVRAATCGDAALHEAAHFTFDLVLTDLMMPGMDGLELIRRLRENLGFGRVPIVLVTANVSPEVPFIAREAGASGVVYKPADVLDLVERFGRGDFVN